MRTAGIKNTPVDRRYFSDQDKSDYNQGAYQDRARAVGRARQYRGSLAYQANSPKRTTVHTPGSGGQGIGIAGQQQRYREIGEQNRRMDGFKPEIKDIYKQFYQ